MPATIGQRVNGLRHLAPGSIGLLLLVVFIAGLLLSNTLIALTSTCGFLRASRRFALYAAVAHLTAVFSLTIDTLFLFGHSTLLPAILGG